MLIPLKDTWGYLGILALDLGFRGASGTADDLESVCHKISDNGLVGMSRLCYFIDLFSSVSI